MQVSRGNILKTKGMLCNPNFVSKNNHVFRSKLYIFPLPTCISTKDGKTGNACFHWAKLTLCFSDQVLVLLCLLRSIKREMLAKLYERRERCMMLSDADVKAECIEASLMLEILGDTRTTNTRHR